MSLSMDTQVRELVANRFVEQLLTASPEKQEQIIRLLINRLPRYVIDGMYIATQALVDNRSEDDYSRQ
jgi:hypothetical protein